MRAPAFGRKPALRSGRRGTVAVPYALSPGAKVKVTGDLTAYHVGGFKAGLPMKDREGVVDSDVTDFKGKALSPNFPWKVKFEVDVKGKTKKFVMHLEESELEAL